MKVLIVDDEQDLLDILSFNLLKNGFEVETATSGEEAIALIEQADDYRLVLLDIMMSGINGFQTAEKIRKIRKGLPVIFLTALDTESDLLHGFSLGADDYIAKPFSVKEVVARVKAVLARAPQKSDILVFENITLDQLNKTVRVDGNSVMLTKTEYLLLSALMQTPGKIMSREDLLIKVWPDDTFVEARTVDVHIARLRKKLLTAGNYLINRSGYGYCLTK